MLRKRLKMNKNYYVNKKCINEVFVFKSNKLKSMFIPGRIYNYNYLYELEKFSEKDIDIWNNNIYKTDYNMNTFLVCRMIINKLKLNDYIEDYKIHHYINFEERKEIILMLFDLPDYLLELDYLENDLYKLYEELIKDDNINYLCRYLDLYDNKLLNVVWFNICRFNKVDMLIIMLRKYDIGFSDLCYLIAEINNYEEIIYILNKNKIRIDDNYNDNDIIDYYKEELENNISIQLFSNCSI